MNHFLQNGVAFTYTHESNCTMIWLLALIYDNTSHKETSFLHQALAVAHTVEVVGSCWGRNFLTYEQSFRVRMMTELLRLTEERKRNWALTNEQDSQHHLKRQKTTRRSNMGWVDDGPLYLVKTISNPSQKCNGVEIKTSIVWELPTYSFVCL